MQKRKRPVASLTDLALRLQSLADEIDKAASATAVDVALTIVEDLAFRTPVDTSKALSNWVVTLSPRGGSIDPHVPGKFGSTQFASASTTILEARRVLEMKKPGQIIYITNSADYIHKLNAGSSSQAPAGFVDIAIALGYAKMKIKLKK